jgi:hypothetical protein
VREEYNEQTISNEYNPDIHLYTHCRVILINSKMKRLRVQDGADKEEGVTVSSEVPKGAMES